MFSDDKDNYLEEEIKKTNCLSRRFNSLILTWCWIFVPVRQTLIQWIVSSPSSEGFWVDDGESDSRWNVICELFLFTDEWKCLSYFSYNLSNHQ